MTVVTGPHIVIVRDRQDDGVIGVYGPFGTNEQAAEAAKRHTSGGVYAAPWPLFPTNFLGSW